MEVRIGIKQSPREITFETNTAAEELRSLVQDAVRDGGLVALSDTKGREYLVSADSVAYVEFGSETGRRVGFVS